MKPYEKYRVNNIEFRIADYDKTIDFVKLLFENNQSVLIKRYSGENEFFAIESADAGNEDFDPDFRPVWLHEDETIVDMNDQIDEEPVGALAMLSEVCDAVQELYNDRRIANLINCGTREDGYMEALEKVMYRIEGITGTNFDTSGAQDNENDYDSDYDDGEYQKLLYQLKIDEAKAYRGKHLLVSDD